MNKDRLKRIDETKNLNPTDSAEDTVTTASETDHADLVAKRAYELYQERGCGEGEELSDWFRAETELKSNPRAKATTT